MKRASARVKTKNMEGVNCKQNLQDKMKINKDHMPGKMSANL